MKKPCPSRLLLGLVVVLAGAASGRAARAQDGAGTPAATGSASGSSGGGSGSSFGGGSFGHAGQWVYSISSPEEFPFWLKKSGDGDWDLVVRPGVDTFLIQSVSVGGIVSLSKNGGGSDIGLGARAGYNISISSLVSFWARAGLYFHHYAVNNGPSGGETIFELKAPFLFHVLPHAFVGVGPFFSLPIQNSDAMAGKNGTYGLIATVGGWL